MAKKVVATLKNRYGQTVTKCIKMDEIRQNRCIHLQRGHHRQRPGERLFRLRRNKCNALGETNVFGSQGRKESSAGPDSENDQRNSIPLNTKGILNGCPLYFHRPATRQNSTDHRGTIRTFVPLSTASPRQDGNKFALHPLIRIFPKYSNAATLKKIWLRPLVVLSLQKTGSDSAIFACKPARLLSSLYYL